jgi:aminomuconate-semialdehyde/2-hydroxymuconate-6-semialdehyde dehydrogenase
MLKLSNFIAGQFVAPATGQYLDVHEPATGEVYAQAPASDARDIEAAVVAAESAFPAWSALPSAERARLLFKLADLIDANLDKLAHAESRDTGKPITLARTMDIPRSAANMRFFAGAVLHQAGEMFVTDQPAIGSPVRAINYTLRRPRGVAGLISPWNLPLYLLTWKIAPALATGNTCVCKPSEVTPVTAHMLAELSLEAGLPAGVLNIVHGQGTSAGGALVTHPRVPTISFTGSTSVGQWIASQAGQMLKRVSLELGGKNPFIIFADADLDQAIATATRAAFTNQGQICLCGSRLLVHSSIYERVRAGVIAGAKSMKIGDPADASTQFGASASAMHLAKIESYITLAQDLGGTIHTGGERVDPANLPARCRNGWFFQPTVIDGLDPICAVEREEIFGPVVTLQPFDDEEHAIALANSTAYGLAATVFTGDVSRAHRISARLNHGLIWINCWLLRDLRTPFGGAKASGVGREGGQEAIKFFTEPSNVCIKL